MLTLKDSYENGFEFDYSLGVLKCGKVRLVQEFSNIFLWNLEIFPEIRGKGLAERLMADIFATIKREFPDVKKVELFVNKGNEIALKVYKKAGFVLSETPSEWSYHHKMGKIL
jgi:ribosomal protein S18 acetylase RimI-like enzyme